MNTSLETICRTETQASEFGGHLCARILVVDDDEALRQINRTMLSLSGYEVDSAGDGQSAWEALQANHYDLLITDNNMPGLSGVELIQKLRAMHRTLPIILASGSLRPATPNEDRLTSVTMLPKPYGLNELLEAVKNTLPATAKVIAAVDAEPVPIEFKEAETISVAPESAGTLTVERYTVDRMREWDGFLSKAKNSTFLFYRDYMDYHRDRFADHSLMVFKDQELVAVLPANLSADGTLTSHEGLTYGGLVVSRTATLSDVLTCFHAVLHYLSERQISKLLYKRIPAFYNTLPDDEVAYALFLLEARLYRRDCSTTISQADPLPLRRDRKTLVKKAIHHGVRLVQEASFQPFWEQVLIPQLASRYAAKPVHTLEEITLLASRFPEQIKQFSAYCGDEIVAGTTIYETPTVAHAQYGAVTEKGRQLGAQAYLYKSLIEQYKDKRYFDFGTSNENEGRAVNHGLMDWKEGFGARCHTHEFYEIAAGNYPKLESALQSAPRIMLPGTAPATSSTPGDHGHAARAYFAHPNALVGEGVSIGSRTRLWAFAHVVRGAVLGEDCNICDHTFIEGGVRMGNRVTVKCGVFLWDGLTIEDDVFIGPSAIFTNDSRPRSKKYLKRYPLTVLREGCTIGAGSTTLPGITIGRWAMVGAGSVVTHDVPDHALVVGSPARWRAWVCQCGEKLIPASGRRLGCICGRTYEQTGETEIRPVNIFSPAAGAQACP